ncbi:VOC family protein [Streptomyces sp. SID3343]|uniref:VOC family protein n=1 Tax=Streptomyces sp. SID3343 TaxID=2690260 RepID=UPI00136A369B|nr:VOC family protein [Streptomyces sp. SID3343]MYV99609.1 glyoxalase [Streptomyces sp. SID3343]
MTLRFHFIGMAVTDMAASLAFYRALGLDIPAEADAQPHVEVQLPDGPLLVWDSAEVIRSFDPDWDGVTGGNGPALAFAFADPAEVDKVYGELVAAGYESCNAPWDAFWGQRYAVVRDADGNGVNLLAPLPDATPQS